MGCIAVTRCTTLGATHALPKPELVYFGAIRADLGTPQEFVTTRGTTRAFFPIVGGVLQAEGLSGAILPGGADWALGLPDGSYAIEAKYCIALNDGIVVMITNAGRMYPQPDGSYLGRTRASFDVPDGAHRALGDAVFFGTALAEADDEKHVYIELWQAPV